MACDAVMDILQRESGRIMTPILKRRTFPRSIIMSLIRRGTFPNEMGETLTAVVYERSAPTDAEPTWNTMTIADGAEGGLCLPPATKIPIASTTRTFSLARRVLEGPDICNIDIRPAVDLYNQLGSVAGILADYARIEWEIHDRHEYFRLCQTKVVVDSCTDPTFTDTMATTYPAVCPTLPLSMATVRIFANALLLDGAGAEALLRGQGGSPVGTMIVSLETRGNIIRQNAAIREDIRFSNEANILIRAFGVSHSYGDIVWLVDPYNRRFDCADGVSTEIAAFSLTAATKGQKAIVRPSYKTAPYEESTWFDPNVFTQLMLEPPVAPYPNFKFTPVDYTGMVQMYNIPDRTCNPDGNIIFHRMHLAAASYPVEPERGVAFLHERCDPEGCDTACAT
jgi:hypothetical protein